MNNKKGGIANFGLKSFLLGPAFEQRVTMSDAVRRGWILTKRAERLKKSMRDGGSMIIEAESKWKKIRT